MEINGYKTGYCCTGFMEYRPGIITPEGKEITITSSEEGAEWFLQKLNEHGILSWDAYTNMKKYLNQWLSLRDEAQRLIPTLKYPKGYGQAYAPNLKTDLMNFIELWKEPDGYYWDKVNDIRLIWGDGNHDFVMKELPEGKWLGQDRKQNISKEFDTQEEVKKWAFSFLNND